MYGAEKELQDMRDQVEDTKEDVDAQRKMARRFIGGQLACAAVIAFSAVLNGYDALPTGGNVGIILVSVAIWIVLIATMAAWLFESYDDSLPGNYRKLARDLARVEREHAGATKA